MKDPAGGRDEDGSGLSRILNPEHDEDLVRGEFDGFTSPHLELEPILFSRVAEVTDMLRGARSVKDDVDVTPVPRGSFRMVATEESEAHEPVKHLRFLRECSCGNAMKDVYEELEEALELATSLSEPLGEEK